MLPSVCFPAQAFKTTWGGSFLITGEHSRVTACTLPEWLLEDIIKQMVNEFAGRLRKELVKLQQTTAVLR